MGADNIVAIHDSWFVPIVVRYFDRDGIQPGRQALENAIQDAGRDWLEDHRDAWVLSGLPANPAFRYVEGHQTANTGIGVVYDWFVAQLIGSPYDAFARSVYDRWRQRLFEGRWPKFTAV